MTLSATETDGTVELRSEGHLLARYRADTEESKPGFDTLALPDGADEPSENLTLWAPHDHSWHLGAFFCPKLVDGINCWESELMAGQDKLHGYAEHERADVRASDGAVTIEQDATWKRSDGGVLLADDREITVHEPADGGYFLDWEQTLTAVGGRRNLSSETLHGHYSGLSLRFARALTDGRVLLPGETEAGTTTPPRAVSGPAARWCDYTGKLDGRPGPSEAWRAGVAMFDHPENGAEPVNWFIMTEPFGFLAANPTWGTVRTLDEGESVTWRWGMWVHGGEPGEDELDAAYERYRTEEM